MPTHVYHPDNDPPTRWDRILVHPYENVISGFCILFGILLCTYVILPSPSMDLLPWWVSLVIGIPVLTGGALSLVGLHWHTKNDEDIAEGLALDRLGHGLQAAALAGFTAAILVFYPGSASSWLISLTIMTGSLLRVISVRRTEKRKRRNVEALRQHENRGTDE